MRTFATPPRPSSSRLGGAGLPGMVAAAGLGLIGLAVLVAEGVPDRADAAAGDDLLEQVLRGRTLVITHACGGCHGGFENPASERWLAGQAGDTLAFRGFRAWPRNLTPDVETGLGAFSERQIFNALRYGLRPRSTPDVEITSAVPGEGNHPGEPDYLSPAMPWPVWRYMSDEELRDVAAYLKHGLRPVSRVVQESEAPPDLWAAEVSVERIDTHVLPPFPTEQEELRDPGRRSEVLLGRRLVASRCGICHGGGHPGREGWMAGGGVDASEAHPVCAFCDQFRILGFWTRPRNLTPHNTTGMGRFSERQIFNALRYGLRPGETADVEVTSTVPGEGNHPAHPKYLAPPMPWPEWRHMSDDELRAIAAYLKHGLKPVAHRVEDSEGPPDFWVGNYTGGVLGTYPAPAFPTARERLPWGMPQAGPPICPASFPTSIPGPARELDLPPPPGRTHDADQRVSEARPPLR
jgi:mono/diheme cytochrome c family protein